MLHLSGAGLIQKQQDTMKQQDMLILNIEKGVERLHGKVRVRPRFLEIKTVGVLLDSVGGCEVLLFVVLLLVVLLLVGGVLLDGVGCCEALLLVVLLLVVVLLLLVCC
jgi:hypothetical protein